MNLESKELPKSFLVQVIWEWLTIRQQTMLSPHPHTSVTSLCAETMQSGWWVLSVISCWKIFIKCRAHGGNTGCRGAVSSAKFAIQGQRGFPLFLHPSFYLRLYCPVSCAQLHKIMTEEQTLLSRGRTKLWGVKRGKHSNMFHIHFVFLAENDARFIAFVFSMLKTQDKSSYCTGKGKKRKGRIMMGTYGVAWGAWGRETTGKLS